MSLMREQSESRSRGRGLLVEYSLLAFSILRHTLACWDATLSIFLQYDSLSAISIASPDGMCYILIISSAAKSIND